MANDPSLTGFSYFDATNEVYPFYGSVADADTYFGMRLHEYAWTKAKPADKPKALLAATQLIDALAYKDEKHSVYLVKDSDPSQAEIEKKNCDQILEFPRGRDEIVPGEIRKACYLIAYALLDGKIPELELESLDVVSQGYSSVRTTYNRTQNPHEHTINMIPSAEAWNLLRPFLRDGDTIRISRVS